MTYDRIARIYEIAAFERPLTEVERLAAGFDGHLDAGHVAEVWERAALEHPLCEHDLLEIELDLRRAALKP